jgi:hypothetical protein
MMDVQVEKGLVFAAHDGSELALDIYRPPHDDAPVAIYVHGGGWRTGDKADDGGGRLAPLSACGVTMVAVNYRLVPRARFPAPLHDLKAAVRWLRGNGPHLGLPAERIGIWEPPREYLGSLLALTAGIRTGSRAPSAGISASPAPSRRWFTGSASLTWPPPGHAPRWRPACCRSPSRRGYWMSRTSPARRAGPGN